MKRLSVILVVLILAVILWTQLRQKTPKPPADSIVIARVGPSYLTEANIINSMNLTVDGLATSVELKLMVERWVNQKLLANAAVEAGLTKNEDILEKLEKLENDLLSDAFLQEEFRKLSLVTEEEINAYYTENTESFVRNKQEILAYHFLLTTREEAVKLKGALNTRNDQELASILGEYSGTLRRFNRDEVIPEISTAAFGARKDIVGPIETEYGFHLLNIANRFRAGSVRSLDEVRDEIIQQIKMNKQNLLYYEIIDSLRMSGDFEINDDYFTR